MHKLALITVLCGGLLAGACDLDVPDLNNPGLGDLTDNPTPAAIDSASTGLLIGNRRNQAAANGYVAQLGILGREAYNFDQADPRFIGELLQGTLNSGSPFGGNFWAGPYANIRLANTILDALDKVGAELSDTEKAGVRGFAKTIMALDLLEVANTRDDIGGVIDTDRGLDEPLGAIVSKDMVLAEIARLLDEGAMDLANAGDNFRFALSSGYAGFDDPAGFATFNRAIRARVAVYQKDYPTALTALEGSFIDDTATADFAAGVYYTYSLGAGDATNALINPNIFAHPSLATDAQKNNNVPDDRFTAKVATTEEPGSAQGLTSDLVFTLYSSPDSPVPLIRNEELLLLRSEARFFTNDVAGAIADLNLVRTKSGGLAPVGAAPNEATYIDELLYERRYSLLFEGGHRWIDARRFDIDLPKDDPAHQLNVRYPIPLAECNGRPNEPACALDSLDTM
jgi:starch-binding outer membrane protein, SusD/RagB family